VPKARSPRRSAAGVPTAVADLRDGETVLGSLTLALVIGLITGAIVAPTRVAPFILPLGGLSVLSSLALISSGQQRISVGLHLASLDLNQFLGIPVPFWVFLGAVERSLHARPAGEQRHRGKPAITRTGRRTLWSAPAPDGPCFVTAEGGPWCPRGGRPSATTDSSQAA
jgi:hypothetical protein